jgi:hypothetical protein
MPVDLSFAEAHRETYREKAGKRGESVAGHA